jgi:hypothetical protein
VTPASLKAHGNAKSETFTIANTTRSACSMTGYPSLTPYAGSPNGSGGGSSVVAQVQHIPASDGSTGAPAQLVTLSPGATAVVFLTWDAFGTSCQSADGIVFNTPVASTFVVVTFAFRFCGTVVKQSVVLPAGTPA